MTQVAGDFRSCKLPTIFLKGLFWGMLENPKRSGTERNGMEPEVVISVSSCRETSLLSTFTTLDREIAIASCGEVREQFSLASWLGCTVF